jgi:hypothetical protein
MELSTALGFPRPFSPTAGVFSRLEFEVTGILHLSDLWGMAPKKLEGECRVKVGQVEPAALFRLY